MSPRLVRSLLRLTMTAAVLLLLGCGGPPSDEAAAERERGPILMDATAEAGLAGYRHVHGGFGQKWMPEIVGPGCAFLDYDGDGRQDMLLAGGGAWPESPEQPAALWLYRNRGNGTFELVTEEAGLGELEVYSFGIAAADYDNDGDTDVFVTTLHENLLLRNDGGVFVEVGGEAGLADEALWSTSALFFDANRDGWLDLFVSNYVAWSPETDVYCGHEGEKGYCTPQLYDGVPSTYYRNNGDGTFTNQTEEAGFSGAIEPDRDKALGVVELDFDQDGWPDLFVANDTERDLLFRNEGDGTFTEQGIRRGVSFDQHGRPRAGMGVDAGVVDTSGQVSIFVGNFSQEMVGVYTNTPSGHFTDRATMSKIGHASLLTLTFGLFLADLDLDTDLDLFLANGHVQEHISEIVEGVTFAQPAQLFLNEGNGSYTEMPASDALPSTPLVGRGAAYGDYDGDGDLDVLIVENDGAAHLWRNDTRERAPDGSVQGPGFLRVSVEGNGAGVNRDGIGTELVAVMDSVRMERRIRSGSSYLSELERVATFGLGDEDVLDALIVTWPDGAVERFEQVGGNRHYHIRQGGGGLEPFASGDVAE